MNGEIIANNIRAERCRVNLSIEDICKHLDISRQTYAEYEKNADVVKASVLVKLSELFKCNISDFFIQK